MTSTTRLLLSSAAAIALAGPALAAGPLVSPVELLDLLNTGKVVALDVRPKAADKPYVYDLGHIPGSIAAPMDMKNWRTPKDGLSPMTPSADTFQAYARSLGIDPGEKVVLIYDGAKPELEDFAGATRAYWTLKSMGHDNVAILNGGVAGWTEAGLPLAKSGTTPADKGRFTASFTEEWRATAADVQAAIGSSTRLVDARPKAQYVGEAKHPKAKKAGSLPGAPNVYGGHMLDADANVKDAKAIEALFAKVGVNKSDDIIAFCNGGFYCSAVWFGANEVAKFPKVRIYDGSMMKWTQDESRPVVPGKGPSTFD